MHGKDLFGIWSLYGGWAGYPKYSEFQNSECAVLYKDPKYTQNKKYVGSAEKIVICSFLEIA
jgi:hypothetical protein